MNKNRPEGGWQGESASDRREAGQRLWQVWLPLEEHEAYEALCKRAGLTKRDLVRQALVAYAKKQK